jgi:2-polyprenyl-6-methoxyphenol hydroxylase-like FAD-dependent oxidoreductase
VVIVRFCVIGAGIGGLSAGIALQRAGHEVQVFERAPELAPVGAGITLWPNAIRALEDLDLREAVLDAGAIPREGGIRTRDGRRLSQLDTDDVSRRYGAPLLVLHRAALHDVLLAQLQPETLRLDMECTAVTTNGDAIATFKGGQKFHADALIGADGIHSVVRSAVTKAGPPDYSGFTAWRAIVDVDPRQLKATNGESWGVGELFGVVPIDDHRVYWFAASAAPEGRRLDPGQEKTILLQRYSTWHEPIPELIELTPPDSIIRSDLYDRRPLAKWTTGRVALLGDAAHPMLPNLGQGACQAIEDAVALGHASILGPLPRVFGDYEAQRVRRAGSIAARSRRMSRVALIRNPWLARARDFVMRATPSRATMRQIDAIIGTGAAPAG